MICKLILTKCHWWLCHNVCKCGRWVIDASGGGDDGCAAACVCAGAGVVALIIVMVDVPQHACMLACTGVITVDGNGGGRVATCGWVAWWWW